MSNKPAPIQRVHAVFEFQPPLNVIELKSLEERLPVGGRLTPSLDELFVVTCTITDGDEPETYVIGAYPTRELAQRGVEEHDQELLTGAPEGLAPDDGWVFEVTPLKSNGSSWESSVKE